MKNFKLIIIFLLSFTSMLHSSLDKNDLSYFNAEKDFRNKAIIEGMLYLNKGALELDDENGNLEQAMSYFSKAQEIFKKHHQEDYLANTYVKQAGICFRTHQIPHAELYLIQALDLNITKRTALSLALANTKLERLKGNQDLALINAMNAAKLANFLGNHNQIKRIQRLIQILQEPSSPRLQP